MHTRGTKRGADVEISCPGVQKPRRPPLPLAPPPAAAAAPPAPPELPATAPPPAVAVLPAWPTPAVPLIAPAAPATPPLPALTPASGGTPASSSPPMPATPMPAVPAPRPATKEIPPPPAAGKPASRPARPDGGRLEPAVGPAVVPARAVVPALAVVPPVPGADVPPDVTGPVAVPLLLSLQPYAITALSINNTTARISNLCMARFTPLIPHPAVTHDLAKLEPCIAFVTTHALHRKQRARMQ